MTKPDIQGHTHTRTVTYTFSHTEIYISAELNRWPLLARAHPPVATGIGRTNGLYALVYYTLGMMPQLDSIRARAFGALQTCLYDTLWLCEHRPTPRGRGVHFTCVVGLGELHNFMCANMC